MLLASWILLASIASILALLPNYTAYSSPVSHYTDQLDIVIPTDAPLPKRLKGPRAGAGFAPKPNIPEICEDAGLENKFTIQEHKAIFDEYTLRDHLHGLLPEGVIINAGTPRHHSYVVTGLRKLWNCVNKLAMDGYTIVGFEDDDIKAFTELGEERIKTPAKVLEILTLLVLQEPKLVDGTLPLSILRNGGRLFRFPDRFMYSLMRRLIPTLTPTLIPETLGNAMAAEMHAKFKFFTMPYFRVNDGTEFQLRTDQVWQAFWQSIMEFHQRDPSVDIHRVMTTISTFAFQADNDGILYECLHTMNMDIHDEKAICAEIASLKRRFPREPFTKFPRIHAWYLNLDHGRCPKVADPTLFRDLPEEVVEHIASKVESMNDRANLKAVNREFRGMIRKLPGGAKCKAFKHAILVNQAERTVRFTPYFLSTYLSQVLGSDMLVQGVFTLTQMRVEGSYKQLWSCMNAIAEDRYTITGFNESELHHFRQVGDSKIQNFYDLVGIHHPLHMLVREIVNAEVVDSSFPNLILRSGILHEYALIQMVWTLMPTARETFEPGTFFSRDFLRLFSRIISDLSGVIVGYHFEGTPFYLVHNTAEMQTKTNELLDSFKEGLIKLVREFAHASPLEIPRTPENILDNLFGVFSYALHSAFSADNHFFLQSVTKPEYIQSICRELGILQFVHSHPERFAQYEFDDLADDDERIMLPDVLAKNLLERIHGETNDKQLVDSIKSNSFFEGSELKQFPNIYNWYQTITA